MANPTTRFQAQVPGVPRTVDDQKSRACLSLSTNMPVLLFRRIITLIRLENDLCSHSRLRAGAGT
jgi:hypothetical protein